MADSATLAPPADRTLEPAERALPVGTVSDVRSSGMLGMLFLILTEATIFGYLIFGYFYTAASAQGAWPPQGSPGLGYALTNLVLAVISAGAVWWADRAIRVDQPRPAAAGLAAAFLLGLVFLGIQGLDWRAHASLTAGAYRSLYLTITGVHVAHLVVGLGILAALSGWTLRGYFGAARSAPVRIGAAYWYFVVAAEVAVFATLSLSPHLS
ncbi:heme-copper oxidase subunit III [Methylobacterium sp. WL64]|uniref:cytochrome c oxidase subunit 3 n=1 Tax=Methylobacterium sp. WL64 TaxID=2603894 RepID=UPI0011CB0CCD|nr:cytochrome c oxidase subunit 3 [Methylobacterium sp. WL64]TXN00678.1 heme-copper oxidase subunit III [Methylobacterium sp. WL64]